MLAWLFVLHFMSGWQRNMEAANYGTGSVCVPGEQDFLSCPAAASVLRLLSKPLKWFSLCSAGHVAFKHSTDQYKYSLGPNAC